MKQMGAGSAESATKSVSAREERVHGNFPFDSLAASLAAPLASHVTHV